MKYTKTPSTGRLTEGSKCDFLLHYTRGGFRFHNSLDRHTTGRRVGFCRWENRMPILKTLYACRPVLNGHSIRAWYREQGLSTTVMPIDMYVTLAYSREQFDTDDLPDHPTAGRTLIIPSMERSVIPHRSTIHIGDEGAYALAFESQELQERWQQFLDAGAVWDYPSFQPHVTLTYYTGKDLDLNKIDPYNGPIELGPESIREDLGAPAVIEKSDCFDMVGKILKVDDDQRMVYGWASVIKEGGKVVLDTQGDTIDAEELVRATTEFMEDARVAKAMHEGDSVGEVVHSFPLTEELAKSLGVESSREGWIVGLRVHDDKVWKAVKSGILKAFSIGGEGARVPYELGEDD